MEFSEQVLILHVGKFKETDMWVRFLSPTRGIVSAFAFGGSRSKKRFLGCLDLFNSVLFRVESVRQNGYLCLKEGVLIKGPMRLRTDWARLGIANNCVKFLLTFGIGGEGAQHAHSLVTDLLQVLEEKDTVPQLLPLFFRLRVAFDQGYEIGLTNCPECGKIFTSDGACFHIRDGHMLCHACARMRGERVIHLSCTALNTLHCVASSSPLQWCDCAIEVTDRHELAKSIDAFIQYHVGLYWDNGRFIRN